MLLYKKPSPINKLYMLNILKIWNLT